MNSLDLSPVAPFLVLAASSVVVLVQIVIYRSHKVSMFLTLGALALTLLSLWIGSGLPPRKVSALIVCDRLTTYFLFLLLAAAFVTALMSYVYLSKIREIREEFYPLLLLATLGAAVLAASNHFASLFLGLEILSISLFALIAYHRADDRGAEAAIKYLVLAGTASAFLVFGLSLLYFALGTADLAQVAARVALTSDARLLQWTGFCLVVVGIGFKLAAVPFHMWTPDVYEGSPTPIAAYVATVSKGSLLAVMVRLFVVTGVLGSGTLLVALTAITVASMMVGSLLALLQDNLKRIIAYSSISHMGYLLVAVQGNGTLATGALLFYLLVYFVSMLGLFGTIAILEADTREIKGLEDYQGLAWSSPLIAVVFTVMLLSLAGLPLTGGFVGKIYILSVGVESALWLQTAALIVSSVIGLFYYLRIVGSVFSTSPKSQSYEGWRQQSQVSVLARVCLSSLAVIVVGLGVFPGPVIDLIQKSVIGAF